MGDSPERGKEMTTKEMHENIFKNVKIDYESKAFKLLERVVEELDKRGIDPDTIEGFINKDRRNKKIGDIEIGVSTIFRHNGTTENVTAEINIREVIYINSYNSPTTKRVARIKVPKDASDKVIKNRVDKALEYLK